MCSGRTACGKSTTPGSGNSGTRERSRLEPSGCTTTSYDRRLRNLHFLPLPVRRERVGVRALQSKIRNSKSKDPHPCPLPEYQEREKCRGKMRAEVTSRGDSIPAEFAFGAEPVVVFGAAAGTPDFV